VIACICAWLGVFLILVALITSHWIDADGFYQGLWLYCVHGRSEYACSATTDRGLRVHIVVVTSLD